ncbi:MAG: hypothetical protein A4E32_00535 [Methanomassiliicoccales archaeon PtaU1.Bin124]|nr:MAG: hypothetical protein A4E32_00535 [Methanomassiliicoccales archaeon PtaU1.Bin124]
MNHLKKHLSLVRFSMLEEYRLNAGMVGRIQFLMFPAMILIMSFVLALASKQLLRAFPLDQAYLMLHAVMMVYGLGVGGFALFGDAIVNRRFGQMTLLIATPSINPVSYRSLFGAFYVKDVIYYELYTIAPLIGGLALSIPFTGFKVTSVAFLLLTLTLTFLIGISLSFAISSLYVRWKRILAAIVSLSILIILLTYTLGWLDFAWLLPGLMLQRTGGLLYLLLSIVLILASSVFALLTLRVRFGESRSTFDANLIPTVNKFRLSPGNPVLLGKDWTDLVRSRSVMPVAGAYIGPLIVVAILFWMVQTVVQVNLSLNLCFYAVMIGFFGVSIYGWLNMTDSSGFMQVLPVRVSQAVRSRLLMLFFFAFPISTAFLAVFAVLRGELWLLPLALAVGYATTAYTVCGTAYLTGLRTNSYLFDPKVLGKFSAITMPPLISMVILSFTLTLDPLAVGLIIFALCILLAVASYLFYQRIERRWGRESFVF